MSNQKDAKMWLLRDKKRFDFLNVLVDRGSGFDALAQFNERTAIHVLGE